jgi:hypothetical protein
MKTPLPFLACLLLTLTHAGAAERVPIEEAQRGVLIANNALGEPKDAPFKLELNAFKPSAIRGDGMTAALVVPAYSLKERIASARPRTPIPAGQLWLRRIVPVVNGKAAAKDTLRMVTVKTESEQDDVSMYHLAFQRFGDGGKLLVIGKGKEPLLEVLLKPMKVPQETPIEIEAAKKDDGTPELVFYVADQFEGRMPIAPAE